MSNPKRAIDVARKKVITSDPDEGLPSLAKKMVDHWISSILVIEKEKPVGIVTDGIIFRLIAQKRNPLNILAKEVMVSPVHTIHANTPLRETEAQFLKTKVNRLALVDDEGKLVGIVSHKDVNRYAAYSLAERMLKLRHEIRD